MPTKKTTKKKDNESGVGGADEGVAAADAADAIKAVVDISSIINDGKLRYENIVPGLAAFGGGAFGKIADVIKFAEKYKGQIAAISQILGLLMARFLKEDVKGPVQGGPTAPPVLPPVPPVIVTPPAGPQLPVSQFQITRIAARGGKCFFIEEDRDAPNAEIPGIRGRIASLERFRQIHDANGPDALMENERAHLDFTPFNSLGQEIPRDVVRGIPGNPDGSAPFKIRYTIDGLEASDSAEIPDQLGLESQNATGHGRDTDNGCTPTLANNELTEGRKLVDVWLELPAEKNFGLAVVSEHVRFYKN